MRYRYDTQGVRYDISAKFGRRLRRVCREHGRSRPDAPMLTCEPPGSHRIARQGDQRPRCELIFANTAGAAVARRGCASSAPGRLRRPFPKPSFGLRRARRWRAPVALLWRATRPANPVPRASWPWGSLSAVGALAGRGRLVRPAKPGRRAEGPEGRRALARSFSVLPF